jgi:hypothetical protein
VTLRTIVTEPCYLCGGSHRSEVLSWSEDGEPLDLRQIEPCPKEPKEPT